MPDERDKFPFRNREVDVPQRWKCALLGFERLGDIFNFDEFQVVHARTSS